MKKFVCSLLCFILAASSISVFASAESTKSTAPEDMDVQYTPQKVVMGDADGNGKITASDVLLIRQAIAGCDVSAKYELSDLNSDLSVTVSDVLLLRKSISGQNVKLGATTFGTEDIDVTDSLENMGRVGERFWPDKNGMDVISARNPFSMTDYGGKVFFACGNYDTNEGPVRMQYLTRNSTRLMNTSGLATEQINKFYHFGDRLFTTAVDPQVWLTGEFYELNSNGTTWNTIFTLQNNIHCYDMVKFNGDYFLSGSNVTYKWHGTYQTEESKAVVFRHRGENLEEDPEQYEEIPFITKDGHEITYFDYVGVPRTYELALFKGELYAMYYDYYWDKYGNESWWCDNREYFNGVYKFDAEKNQFIYCEGLDLETPFNYEGVADQDTESPMRDFEWNDNYVVINNALFMTKDLKTWDKIDIPGYEKYIVRDCKAIGDKFYVLANVKGENDHYTNAVFETSDFKSFRSIMHFDTFGWVRSMAYTDGTFFFGIGANRNEIQPVKDGDITEVGMQCGTIYRYVYYK